MSIENGKRLLMKLDMHRRDINQRVISDKLTDVSLDKILPIANLIANVRAAYLGELFSLGERHGDTLPSLEELEKLKNLRLAFQELVDAATAMETALESNYVDISDMDE